METGFFIHFSNYYRLSWLWFVILLSFQRTIALEGGIGQNIIMRIIWLLIWIFFAYLIWPRRFMVIGDDFYITKVLSSKVIKIDKNYVNAVHFSKHSFEFSYAGKHYRFLMIANASKILKKEFSSLEVAENENNNSAISQH